ncbi:hypothetical protein ACE6ED_09905 [Paenibacillus sp. CN-4]|uniref:hypothetical protein n=1 Tax=Paenibacillus nanchangensis TaxID=3348343 RepID=UPI003978395D
MKNKLKIIVNLLLAGSIVFAAVWIGESIKQSKESLLAASNSLNQKGLLNREEAAKYMSMDEGQFYILLNNIEIENQRGNENWDEQKRIRTITIHGIDYFGRVELDRWIDYMTRSGSEI